MNITTDKLTTHEWLMLKEWFSNPQRKLANLAFTSGAARDAATAFEFAQLHRDTAALERKVAGLERSLELMKKSRAEYMRAYREARDALPFNWEPPKPLSEDQKKLLDVNLADPDWTKKFDASTNPKPTGEQT